MHAYLIIGNDTLEKEKELIDKLNGKSFDFPVSKIEEVRQLNDFLKHTQAENTIITTHAVDDATTEALNAFLKNLEEPQKNVRFVLTARNEYKVLPTILSRCQIIKITNYKLQITNHGANEFLSSNTGNRLLEIDRIKGRPDAIKFVQDLTDELHGKLDNKSGNYRQTASRLEAAQNTLNSLNANGNVNLQLSTLVVNLDAG